LTLLVAAGCSSTGSPAADGKVSVVTTTTQLTDFAKVIGGDHASVHGLLTANRDPHDFDPSPADLDRLTDAQVILTNGVGLERWLKPTLDAADPSGEVVDTSRGVEIRHGNGTDEEAEGDPHIWQSPANAKIMVTNVERALAKADPAHEADYARNLAAYTAKLDALDRQIKAQIDALPNKALVTNHDAFGYYIDRYGLQFEGSIIPSFDTSAQLSASDIDKLVAKIKATHTKAVFSETSLPPKAAEAIGKEAHVRVVTGENALYGDSLGPKGSDGDTYLKMLRHNTKVIVDNLR
jgi:zinc/manganese transport system substrate-binding protein/manganese/iron transport system substrate-binding protein